MSIIRKDRSNFHKADYPSDAPLLDHPFSRWMIEEYKSGTIKGETTHGAITAWLATLGFVKGSDFLPRGTFEQLRYAADVVCTHWRRLTFRHTFAELFTLIDTPKIDPMSMVTLGAATPTWAFPIYINSMWQWVRFTDKMVEIANTAPMVYPKNHKEMSLVIREAPDTEEEPGDYVVAINYQYILGSRLLATVTDMAAVIKTHKEYNELTTEV